MRVERTKNTISGSIWGITNRIVCIVFPFIIRTVIIYVFGTEYLGINSLFSSILHVLNLTELGLSSAIVYHMYQPIADDDYKTLSALLKLYRKLYRIVGCVVLILGLICIPFLSTFVKGDYPSDINIYVLYLLFLANTSISYFFYAYKESILFAYQRNDIINKIRIITFLLLYVSQLFFLLVTKDYYLFVASMVCFTLLKNYINARVVEKMYPQIECKGSVDKECIESIKLVVSGAAIAKLCAATRGSCSDIIVSSFIGLTALAVFDNYYYIMAAVISILIVIETSLSAGVGNSVAMDNIEKNHKDFENINFVFMWIVGTATVCMACLYQPFMELWVGKDLLFDDKTMFLFCGYFFASGMSSIPSIYANANGLWWKLKYKSIAEVLFNIIFCLLLGYFYGVPGILVALIVSLILISFGWGCQVLYDNYFKNLNLWAFVSKQIIYLMVTSITSVLTYYLCSLIPSLNTYLDIVLRLFVGLISSNFIFVLCYHRTKHFPYIIRTLKSIKK